jgi:hypothetical protein
MSKYFVPVSDIQGGDSVFWCAQLAPLIMWGILVYRYYYIPQHHQNNPITNFLLFIPVLGLLYNVYLGYNHKGPSPPRSWNFCLDTKVKSKDKDKGVVGYFDYSCLYNHETDMDSNNAEYTKRLYYLNYILFFVVLVIQSADSKKSISTENFPMLINVLGMDCLLVIIGSIVPLFSSSPLWSYIILCFLSGVIWMSSTLLLIIMVNMYKYLITGSTAGSTWKKNRWWARKSNK